MEIRTIQFQQDLIAASREKAMQGYKRIILQAPTGAGKTICACFIVQNAVAKGKRVLFVVDARKLAYQASEKMTAFGIPHGIIMAGLGYDLQQPVQVVSKDTLLARAVRSNKIDLPPADLVITDECHRALGKELLLLLGRYPDAFHIGLSGTPARLDGRGLNELYQAMVCAPTDAELIKLGAIVPTVVFGPRAPDLKGLQWNKDGECKSNRKLAERFDTKQLVGDIVQHWIDFGENRLTVCFACNVAHSLHIRDKFEDSGIGCQHLDADSNDAQRDEAINNLLARKIQVVTQVGIWVQGVDIPELSCGIMAKHSRSLVYWRQCNGRLKRPAPWAGKTNALMLDHAGMWLVHGLPDDPVEWSLEATDTVQERKARSEPPESHPKCCPKCFCIFSKRPDCPNCGFVLKKKPQAVKTKAGRLEKVTDRFDANPEAEYEQKLRIWKRCMGICIGKGLPIKCAAGQYRTQTGNWPSQDGIPDLPHGSEEWQMQARDFYRKLQAEKEAQYEERT